MRDKFDSKTSDLIDDEAGMRWFNAITPTERKRWLRRAGSARPVDAWRAFKARRGPGRPPKADALSPAERARRYRARKKAEREARRDQSKPLRSDIIDLSAVNHPGSGPRPE